MMKYFTPNVNLYKLQQMEGLFKWKWAGPVKGAGSPRWGLTFLKKLL